MRDAETDHDASAAEVTLAAMLERNRAFVAGRATRPLEPVRTLRLAVVACYDPRLDELLLPSLGLAPGDAFLLRTAGALVQDGSSALRSLAMAVYMFGVTEILVLGHRACRMAAFETNAFIEAFRRRGVARDAFGTDDLRIWAGAIASPAQGVAQSAANIRGARFFPRDLSVAGAVLDESTGALEAVRLDDVVPWQVVPPADVVEQVAPLAPPPEMRVPLAEPAHVGAVAIENVGRASPADEFVRALHGAVAVRAELPKLRQELERSSNPVAKLRTLESFTRRSAPKAPELALAFERLRREVLTSEGGHDFRERIATLLELVRKV